MRDNINMNFVKLNRSYVNADLITRVTGTNAAMYIYLSDDTPLEIYEPRFNSVEEFISYLETNKFNKKFDKKVQEFIKE
jgi:hypothetical protein